MKRLLSLAVVSVIGFGLSGCGEKEDKKHSKSIATSKPYKDFVESDFYWDKRTEPYKKILVNQVNNIRKNNPKCNNVQADVIMSNSKGTKENPVFFVMCGSGADIHNVFFTKKEAEAQIVPKQKKALSETVATQICSDKIKSNASRPESVNVHNLLGKAYTAHSNGNATVILNFDSQNGLGIKIENQARCVIQPNGKIDIWFQKR
ncbi:hypothetical protein ALC152_01490 [Arcobacter sp. 15-2]|uniref:LptM family lipoprotein n=1 Tax=Arcobacter sp. 15-2 TaxID=3374109 RepID=UPI00399C87F3